MDDIEMNYIVNHSRSFRTKASNKSKKTLTYSNSLTEV
jgi:hypothetical protein